MLRQAAGRRDAPEKRSRRGPRRGRQRRGGLLRG